MRSCKIQHIIMCSEDSYKLNEKYLNTLTIQVFLPFDTKFGNSVMYMTMQCFIYKQKGKFFYRCYD